MDVKTLEYHIITRNTRAHDDEQPAALENHNMIQPTLQGQWELLDQIYIMSKS